MRYTSNSNSLQPYIADIRNVPQLSREEGFQLAVKSQSGDDEARTQMILAHLPFVVSIAKRYGHFGVPLGDLVAEGNIALMKAIDRYDPCQGAKLSTYAVWSIRQAIRTAIGELGRTIRMPSSALVKTAKINRVKARLTETLGRVPSIEELAKATKTPFEKIAHLNAMAERPASLAEPVGSATDDYRTIEGNVVDERAIPPNEALLRADTLAVVEGLMERLDSRERRIVELRYGLNGAEPRTLDYVAKEFGVTRERIRQLQDQATKKLQSAWACLDRQNLFYQYHRMPSQPHVNQS